MTDQHKLRFLVESTVTRKAARKRLKAMLRAHGFDVHSNKTARRDKGADLQTVRNSYTIEHSVYGRARVRCHIDGVRTPHQDYVEITLKLERGQPGMLNKLDALFAKKQYLYTARHNKRQRLAPFHHTPFSLYTAHTANDWPAIYQQVMALDLECLKEAEPYAWEGLDIEGVHHLRVASRRLRAHLLLFQDYSKKQHVRKVRRDLKALGQVLGPVRDDDVHLSQLHHSEVLDRKYLHEVTVRRVANMRKLRRHLAQHFAKLQAAIVNLKIRNHAAANPYRRLVQALERAVNAGQNVARNPIALHELRKCMKTVNYQLEIVAAIEPSCLALHNHAKHLHNLLGEFQDREMALSRLRTIADPSNTAPQLHATLTQQFVKPSEFWPEFEASWQSFSAALQQVQNTISSTRSKC